MLFNSLTFIVFFTVILLAFWNLRNWELRKNLLLVASYLFYGAWNPPFALLLFATTALDFWLGERMAQAATPGSRRGWLILSLASNLSSLGFFKYGNFLLENFTWVMAQAGVTYVAPKLDIFLPVGISFYTLHSLSYTLDIYRGAIQPTRSLRVFALAVSFFPQLVAGPIVRAADFLPQCAAPPVWSEPRFWWGTLLMSLGLFEKVVLADTLLAPTADAVFAHPAPLTSLDAWAGVLAFAGQIFFDFAGYSTCAIGAALMLGFHLRDNFLFPYAAIGFSDFWRRWHISLSTFLRDYLYIPLGGNRAGGALAARNLVIVMFIGGLWHGAAWTFVVWGLLHGFYLVVEHLLRSVWKDAAWTDSLGARLAGVAITFVGVCVAWVFFRAADFGTASRLLGSMFGLIPGGALILPTRQLVFVGGVVGLLLVMHWVLRDTTIEAAVARLPRLLLVVIWILMVAAVIFAQSNATAFIYFQF